MSTMEDIEAAEAKMISAKNSLLSYVEGRRALDRDTHKRLVNRLKKAETEFMKALRELAS
jgi:hypothetical protein